MRNTNPPKIVSSTLFSKVTFLSVRVPILSSTCFLSASSSALREVILFDIYRGRGIEEGRKSVALGLILQDKGRTLTDEDTDRLIESVKGSLVAGLQASFRE